MAKALYRKYRSKSLDEIVGQRHVTDILKKAVAGGRISHAYLLTGPRGVGKTSVARILAHEINGLPYTDDSSHLDIIEIDAASNNGVEDIRDLRDKVQVAPVSAVKKIYIVDEVHMLSKAAFNALLKTLEEPPEHVVFILATTDVDKLPATIVSRTQRYGFRAIGTADLISHLGEIAEKEAIVISDDALALIAEQGDGSFRDSISLLDQLSSLSDDKAGITAELVESSLGLASGKLVTAIIAAVEARQLGKVVTMVDDAVANGISPTVLAGQLARALRRKIVDTPDLIPLLDSLLDVGKSSQSALKLIVVLGAASRSKQSVKTAALTTPVLEVSASVKELQDLAEQPAVAELDQVAASVKPPAPIDQPVAKRVIEKALSSAFDWDALIDYTRQHFVAIYSVLSKCQYDLDGTDLTLYAQNNFYKKKLDDAKYNVSLFESLKAIGCPDLTIQTVPSSRPPKDSQAAMVAAIMGGGEEVSVETL